MGFPAWNKQIGNSKDIAERRCGLLCDRAASDAISRIAGRIGLHVISFGVNHQCGSAIAEERVAAAVEIHVLIQNCSFGAAVTINSEVVHITGVMTFGVHEAVLLVIRIKVRTNRLEIGRRAGRVLMKVDGVLARRKAMQVKPNRNAGILL